jgi:uncharacterized DUF497 family protein
VDIEFNPAKDAANIAAHGVSLRYAAVILSERLGDVADTRKAYGEARRIAFAQVGDAFWACAYTMRGSIYRPISAHRVREKEVRRWLRA